MSVAPVVNQLRDALRERTRLEDDFKLKILNRINAILEQLNNCDQESLPAPAAGALNIAIHDLNDIVREIRNPVNMTDAAVEEIVEPLQRRRRNNTVRLLPAGRPVDGPRPLSNPAPASSLTGSRTPFSIGSPSTWFSRPRSASPEPVELGRLRTPDRPDVPDPAGLDYDIDDEYPDFPGGPLGQGLPRMKGRVPPVTRRGGSVTRIGGKRTRRKYRNRT